MSLRSARAAYNAVAFLGRLGGSGAPKAEIPKTPDEQRVKSVDLLTAKNQPAHHTDPYEYGGLVVRRGQAFDVEITLAKNDDAVVLTVELWWGDKPMASHDNFIVIPVRAIGGASDDVDEWAAKVTGVQETKMTVRISSPSTCQIGRYKMAVKTSVGETNDFRFELEGHIYVLFNPWCKDDDVFMHNEEQRKEYVLNDMGMYFYGNSKYVGSSPWYFGQFELGIMECVVRLLESAEKRFGAYSSSIEISRLLSALVNSPDEGGILVGNWSGNYEGGTEPTAWSGSASIFEEFIRTGQPVKYGQCWVFGGLLTTALRAVGIPARTITNFSSAHDADANCLLDYHFDKDGKSLNTADSVWNFHVWNDAWMARHDLPKGYGGWQAVDSTPQEYSDYVFRCGPASLTAIKSGHVYLSYDTKFVFAEVNACKVKWMISTDYSVAPKIISIETDAVGTSVLTKAVGKMEREDITSQYKPEEGSIMEYLSLFTADKHVDSLKKLIAEPGKDTNLDINLPEDVLIGKDFTVKAKFKKTCPVSELRSVTLYISCTSMYYTGVKAKLVFESQDSVEIKDAEAVHEWQVKAIDYLPNLVDQANLRFQVTMFVAETNQIANKGSDFRLIKPDLEVQVPKTVAAGTSFTVDVKFTNPLSTILHGCFFHTEGPAVLLHKKEAFRNIKGNETVQYQVTAVAKKPSGTKEILVSFSSLDLIGVMGKAFVNIV
ncbi:protein-glutamine gamma-glutamyltransferase K-like isoform X2 [Patiria miniata]|uniref:Transglutaminase-like domain-containing protein n=1 Tax=Patiria miniata TaxID=46514 RepID=A0A913ZZ79_PATMI|nr:protein-glutamine gamma-glutamyltransferase K-like isoform X2 [Patiria miniata]